MSLRNEIEGIIFDELGDSWGCKKVTDQILSLIEGSLPPKNNQRCGTYWEMGYRKGWNTCLQEIKEKIK